MGNALVGIGRSQARSVHPHVHGERYGLAHGVDPDYGSSPRTWGTHDDFADREEERRFIPTYMGNALCDDRRAAVLPVHPHVHGERECLFPRKILVFGSSPRTWGTHR